MSPSQIIEALQQKFGSRIQAVFPHDKHPRVHVDAADGHEVLAFLRNDPAMRFDWLANLSGIDYAADEKMCVCYDLWSFELHHRFAVKVFALRSGGQFDSTVDLWPAANWHEREAYDLFGMTFRGHPNLQRMFMEEDWVGHPLRKDYEFPKEYHGIRA